MPPDMSNVAVIDECAEGHPANGNTVRRLRHHDKLIATASRLMGGGEFRPSAERIAGGAGLSLRSLYNHFSTVAEIWEAALDDSTKTAILSRVMPNGPWPASEDCSRIVRAIVWGRLSQ